jgi:hypothetical protein
MNNQTNYRKVITSQFFAFLLSSIVFLVAAGFGWEKLHTDELFSADEGYQMTESWRLASGDRLFQDKSNDALRLYTIFNALIFKIKPKINLLTFRKLQYILTILSLLIFSTALFKFIKEYWFLPLIFSLFALTGLFPWNIEPPNLNYYTYPHLFLILHLSFLLLGLHQKVILTKRLLFIASGLSIWGSSFSLLHTSIVALGPILLFVIHKKFNFKSFSLKLADLCFVLVPFLIAWIAFIAIYRESYILAVISSIKFELSNSTYVRWKSEVERNTLFALKCVAITLVYIVLSFSVLKRIRILLSINCLMILSLFMVLIIRQLSPPGYEVTDIPIWFSSFLTSFIIVFWFKIIRTYFAFHYYNRYEEICITLLIPSTLLSLTMSVFSFNKLIMVMLSSIPITAAISIFIVHQTKLQKESYPVKALGLIFFLLPFYFSLESHILSNSNKANFEIQDGFGQGLKANEIQYKLYNWIKVNTEKYTDNKDYIISMIDVPMVYMIAKRRPSLDTSWITFTFNCPSDLFDGEIIKMEKENRNPKIAFIINEIFGKFYMPENPVLSYIEKNMMPVSKFSINGQLKGICFVDRKFVRS